MSISRYLVYGLVVALVVGAYLLIEDSLDGERVLSDVASSSRLTDNATGASVLSPDSRGVTLISYPNPQGLSAEEWVYIDSGKASEGVVYAGSVFRRHPGEGRYVVDTGVAMLEITFDASDESTIETVLNSFAIVSRPRLRELDLAGFSGAFDNMVYDNSTPGVNVVISKDNVSNELITKIGVGKGYKPRLMVAEESVLVNVDGKPTRPEVAEAWKSLASAAKAAGVPLIVKSGFRGSDEQVEILNYEYSSLHFAMNGSYASINDAEIDKKVISAALDSVALPGYSKHHTGWTLDITQEGFYLFGFKSTPAFEWISADNYLNARKHGFLPSYPEGGPAQGPEPEAWEYVFVGRDYLGI